MQCNIFLNESKGLFFILSTTDPLKTLSTTNPGPVQFDLSTFSIEELRNLKNGLWHGKIQSREPRLKVMQACEDVARKILQLPAVTEKLSEQINKELKPQQKDKLDELPQHHAQGKTSLDIKAEEWVKLTMMPLMKKIKDSNSPRLLRIVKELEEKGKKRKRVLKLLGEKIASHEAEVAKKIRDAQLSNSINMRQYQQLESKQVSAVEEEELGSITIQV